MPGSDESKQERFKRLASSRTKAVLKKIQVLGNCANRHVYDYTKEDIEKIFSALERKLRETKSKFIFPEEEDFRL